MLALALWPQIQQVNTLCFGLLIQVGMILAVIIGLVWVSLIAQAVKNLPAMQGMWVQSLAWENPLEEEVATHSSILSWGIPWTEEPGRLPSMGLQKSQT